ncbi:DNA repair protein RecO [Kistimonas asteriae]|uniref:DNA repair protein RecO n=1 Tax=Kistimonas asteriae TaxID=517724 RepID=UPI001BAC8EC4|nr:DNA repair protein RecO [Kistimonas asteriae]
MANTFDLQPAWVLHTRPYRDTSLLVDCLTRHHGKVSLVASGARGATTKAGKPRRGHLLQPFSRLLISWTGKAELKTLRQLEQDRYLLLTGRYLYSGLYANELLIRLLQPGDAVANLFDLYEWLVDGLSQQLPLEIKLRVFEKLLLEALGYGIPLSYDGEKGQAIRDDQYYLYQQDSGFVPCRALDPAGRVPCFSGVVLNAFARNEVTDSMLPDLKRLTRMALAPLLGNRPLRSRELFRQADPV